MLMENVAINPSTYAVSAVVTADLSICKVLAALSLMQMESTVPVDLLMNVESVTVLVTLVRYS
jgi:hypothetical protein